MYSPRGRFLLLFAWSATIGGLVLTFIDASNFVRKSYINSLLYSNIIFKSRKDQQAALERAFPPSLAWGSVMITCTGLILISTIIAIVGEYQNRYHPKYLMVSNGVALLVWSIWLICTPLLPYKFLPYGHGFTILMLAAYPLLILSSLALTIYGAILVRRRRRRTAMEGEQHDTIDLGAVHDRKEAVPGSVEVSGERVSGSTPRASGEV